jgi:hypothetical protein
LQTRRVGISCFSGLSAALVDTGDFGTRSPHEFRHCEAQGTAHELVHGQRPFAGIDPRDAKMAEHDRIFGARYAIE